MTTVATLENIRRKAAWADHVQLVDGKPLPSWIELSLTELCNRSAGARNACVFCPRIDAGVYPNQKLHMPVALARKIAAELHLLKYEGAVVLCGFGEPMLHPQLSSIVECFGDVQVEMVTNGDFLRPLVVRDLVRAGLDYFAVSLYDGPHQLDDVRRIFDAAGVGSDHYVLRDRWHGPDQDYGLKLTNRAGTVEAGNQAPVDKGRACWYIAYQMVIDWNGDVLLCCQDWSKRVRFGNLHQQTILDVWRSPAMHRRRMRLIKDGRTDSPCSACNADGQVHGKGHVEAWG